MSLLNTIIFLFSFSMFASNKALVVIDMQVGFVERNKMHSSSENIINLNKTLKNQVEIINKAKENNIPIYLVQYLNAGETLPEIMEALKGYQHFKFFIKNRDDLFDPESASYERILWVLNNSNIKELVFVGANAGVCVYASMYGALVHKFTSYAYVPGIIDLRFDTFDNAYDYASPECDDYQMCRSNFFNLVNSIEEASNLFNE